MINFDILKDEYAELTGIEMFNEEGELQDFYREVNKIEKPICGIWHANPMPLTAVRKPFCGIATVDITVVSHPEVWETTRDTMNTVASALNGTSREITVDGTVYSISYNCQTCGIGNRILDANIGHGEVFEIRQQISYIIIESGVSAYDTFLYIDGLQIPFLSLVENKIHTTSNIASANGVMLTASEAEAYGIDFVIPYMKDDAGSLVRDVIDRATGNEAHCVVLDIAGVKHCHIMQFTHVSANVQPPQNIGMNVSMTELDPTAAKYNGMWEVIENDKKLATLDTSGYKTPFVVFWGDGCTEYFNDIATPYHIYDDEKARDIIIFHVPMYYYKHVDYGENHYGKNLYILFEADEIPVSVFGDLGVLSDGESSLTVDEYWGLHTIYKSGYTFMHSYKKNGEYYVKRGQKIQCLLGELSTVSETAKQFIYTSVWD
jgi:hypothetical protein